MFDGHPLGPRMLDSSSPPGILNSTDSFASSMGVDRRYVYALIGNHVGSRTLICIDFFFVFFCHIQQRSKPTWYSSKVKASVVSESRFALRQNPEKLG